MSRKRIQKVKVIGKIELTGLLDSMKSAEVDAFIDAGVPMRSITF